MWVSGPHLSVCILPNVDRPLDELLVAARAAPVGAQALLHGGHQALQVLGEVLVLVPEQVDLQACLVDLRAVLSFGHPVPDPQHLHCGVIAAVHQVEEMLHKLLAQEDSQLPGKALVVPENHIEDHEEAVDGTGVFQADFDVQRGARYGLSSCLDVKDASPREHRPPEGTLRFLIVVDGGTNLLKQRLGSEETVNRTVS